MTAIEAAWISIRGKRKKRNEDWVLAGGVCARGVQGSGSWRNPETALAFGVLDGMGGHPCGDEASKRTGCLLQRYVSQLPGIPKPGETLLQQLQHLDLPGQTREISEGRTTLTSLVIQGPEAVLLHAGDSQAFLRGRTHLIPITARHADHGPGGSGRLTNWLGKNSPGWIDLREIHTLEPARTSTESSSHEILICTDGLTDMVPEPTLAHILRGEPYLEPSADEMARQARNSGGLDNISLVLLRIRWGANTISEHERATERAPVPDDEPAPNA